MKEKESGPKARWSLRFVHVADLRYGEPVQIQEDMPGELRDQLLTAKRTVLRRILEAAKEHDARFVLLVGDTLRPRDCSPGLLRSFLGELARTDVEELPVYWYQPGVAGALPSWCVLPKNLRLLRRPRLVRRPDGGPAVGLAPWRWWRRAGKGTSRASFPEGWQREKGPVLVAAEDLTWQELMAAMERRAAAYWALAGPRRRATFRQQVGYSPGQPQAEELGQWGAHGCTLVEITADGAAQVVPLNVDVARWVRIHIRCSADAPPDILWQLAQRQVVRIRKAWPQHVCLASWIIHLRPGLNGLGKNPHEVFQPERLRQEWNARFGRESPALWSVEVNVCPHKLGSLFPRGNFMATFLEEMKAPGIVDECIQELSMQWRRLSGSEAGMRAIPDERKSSGWLARRLRQAAWEGICRLAKGGPSS